MVEQDLADLSKLGQRSGIMFPLSDKRPPSVGGCSGCSGDMAAATCGQCLCPGDAVTAGGLGAGLRIGRRRVTQGWRRNGGRAVPRQGRVGAI